MPIDQEELFEVLVCPSCGSLLDLHADEWIGTSVQCGSLQCRNCSALYRIERSRPQMLLSSTERDDKPFWVCNGDERRHERFRLSWAEHHEVIEGLIPPGDGLCLDLGAGGGGFSGFIESQGYDWVGIDIVDNANLLLVGDGNALPFVPETFDLVVMLQVIEHLPDPWNVLREANKVLKPGGILVGSVSFLEHFHDSYFHFTHWGVERLLQDTGFSCEIIRPAVSGLLTLLHALTTPGPDGFSSLLLKALLPLLLLLRRQIGMVYLTQRFGKASEEFRKLDESFLKLPWRLAGSFAFLASKRQRGTKHTDLNSQEKKG